MTRVRIHVMPVLLTAAVGWTCSGTNAVGDRDGSGVDHADDTAASGDREDGGADRAGDTARPTCVPVACIGFGTVACGDCVDNDGDGLTDMDDPHCAGPCDQTEENFAVPDLPGANPDPCRLDCRFDSDIGIGNDGCDWKAGCDPLNPVGAACSAPEASVCSGLAANLTTCRNTCLPAVPHGCDCFGCCELPARSGQFVWLNSNGGTCASSQDLADPQRCRPCTPVPSCLDTCDACELCIGDTAVPAGCAAPACPAGTQSCGVGDLPRCAPGAACIGGCCVTAPWFGSP